MMTLELYLDHIGNMIFLIGRDHTIYKTWSEGEFTERKLNNAVKKIGKNDPMGRTVEVKEMVRG